MPLSLNVPLSNTPPSFQLSGKTSRSREPGTGGAGNNCCVGSLGSFSWHPWKGGNRLMICCLWKLVNSHKRLGSMETAALWPGFRAGRELGIEHPVGLVLLLISVLSADTWAPWSCLWESQKECPWRCCESFFICSLWFSFVPVKGGTRWLTLPVSRPLLKAFPASCRVGGWQTGQPSPSNPGIQGSKRFHGRW